MSFMPSASKKATRTPSILLPAKRIRSWCHESPFGIFPVCDFQSLLQKAFSVGINALNVGRNPDGVEHLVIRRRGMDSVSFLMDIRITHDADRGRKLFKFRLEN